MLTLRSAGSSVKLVKSLPCCATLSIAIGSTLQELSHLCATLHFAMYMCSSCLLYVGVTRRRAGPVQEPLPPGCHWSWALVPPEMFPAQFSGRTRAMEITPVQNKLLLGSSFPPAEGIHYRPELDWASRGRIWIHVFHFQSEASTQKSWIKSKLTSSILPSGVLHKLVLLANLLKVRIRTSFLEEGVVLWIPCLQDTEALERQE